MTRFSSAKSVDCRKIRYSFRSCLWPKLLWQAYKTTEWFIWEVDLVKNITQNGSFLVDCIATSSLLEKSYSFQAVLGMLANLGSDLRELEKLSLALGPPRLSKNISGSVKLSMCLSCKKRWGHANLHRLSDCSVHGTKPQPASNHCDGEYVVFIFSKIIHVPQFALSLASSKALGGSSFFCKRLWKLPPKIFAAANGTGLYCSSNDRSKKQGSERPQLSGQRIDERNGVKNCFRLKGRNF